MKNNVAKVTLTIVAEYDSLPDKSELVEVLDAIRSYGTAKSAILKVMEPAEIDLLREGY